MQSNRRLFHRSFGLLLLAPGWLLLSALVTPARPQDPCQNDFDCLCTMSAKAVDVASPPVGYSSTDVPVPTALNNGCCLKPEAGCTVAKQCNYNKTITVTWTSTTVWKLNPPAGGSVRQRGTSSFEPGFSADCGSSASTWGVTSANGTPATSIELECKDCNGG